ncbi:MAG: hypothetical protein EOP81_10225 [Variovorax sp.]|nr:MAG: hypothetical protein EOP81_10225 [Variovorax sp.]
MAKTELSKLLDPMALWRDALTQWEGGANTAATKQMGSEEFAQALHAVASVSTGIQQALGQANGALLKELNLPSRSDLIDIGARLQRIEDAIGQINQRLGGLAPAPAGANPKQMPPRTRKPPSTVAAAAAAPAPVAAAPATKPARSRQPARKSAKKKA